MAIYSSSAFGSTILRIQEATTDHFEAGYKSVGAVAGLEFLPLFKLASECLGDIIKLVIMVSELTTILTI